MVAIDTIHLLTSTRGETDRQVVEGVEQQTGHRRRIAAARTLMVYQELADGRQVLAYLRRHDVERTAQRQYRIHILDMRIERERAVSADAIVSRQLLHVDNDGNEVTQTCLVQHGTLRLTSRSRGVDHVGETVGIREVDRLSLRHIGHEIVDKESLGSSRTEVTLCLLGS